MPRKRLEDSDPVVTVAIFGETLVAEVVRRGLSLSLYRVRCRNVSSQKPVTFRAKSEE